MPTLQPPEISGAVEGLLDEAVLRRVIEHVGARPGPVHGKNGKPFLRKRLPGYNQAAYRAPWLVLVDLDQDENCAPPFVASWLPQTAPYMCLRVVVREVESWLFADRERLARFLRVRLSRVPEEPEAVAYPKRVMVDVARFSRSRDIREDMVPRPGSGRTVGPNYTARLIQFVTEARAGWRPEIAAQRSDSLAGCLRCISGLAQRRKRMTPTGASA